MNATIRGEAHEVEVLAILLGIAIGCYDLLVLHDAVIGTSAVNLHEVLVYHTAGTDVEVTYLRAFRNDARQYALRARHKPRRQTPSYGNDFQKSHYR